MNLEDIRQKLENNIAAGKPLLTGTPLDDVAYHTDIGKVIDVAGFKLTDAGVIADDTRVYVKGRGTILHFAEITISIGFDMDGDDLFLTLEADVDGIHAFGPLERFGSPIQEAAINWRYGPLLKRDASDWIPPISLAWFRARLGVPGIEPVAIIVNPPAFEGETEWTLRGDFAPVALPSLDRLLNWLNGSKTADLFPKELIALGGLTLRNLDIRFDPAGKSVTGVSLAIAMDKPWTPGIGKLKLDDLLLAVGYLTNEKGEGSVSARVSGHLDVTPQSKMAFSLTHARGTSALDISSEDGVPLPHLQDLGDLIGAGDLVSHLPDVLTQVKNVRLRHLRVTFDGELRHAGIEIDVRDRIPLAGDKAHLEGIDFQLNLEPSQTPPLQGELTGLVVAGSRMIPVDAVVAKTLEFSSYLQSLDLQAIFPDLPDTFPQITLSDVRVRLSTAGTMSFSAAIALDFRETAEAFGIPLPDSITNVHLSSFEAKLDLSDQSWELRVSTERSFAFPAGGRNRIEISRLALRVGKGSDGKIGTACSFTLDGQLALTPQAKLSFNQLGCSWDSTAAAWDIGGLVTGDFFGQSLTLTPVFGSATGTRSFSLQVVESITLPVLKPISALTLSELAFHLESSKGDDGKTRSDWGVSGRGALSLEPLFANVAASLSLETGTKGNFFRLQCDAIPARTLTLALGLEARIAVDPLSIEYAAPEGGKTAWTGKAGAELTLLNVPEALQRFLPVEALDAEFGFAPKESYLKVKSLDLKQDLPALKIGLSGGRDLDLGRASITLRDFTLRFGKILRVTETLVLSGLGKTNRIFGLDPKGTPTTRVLKDSFPAEFGLTSKGAVTIRPLDSPFETIPLREEEDGTLWSDWNFGDFGRYSFQVPVFDYRAKTSSWQASGGFACADELRLPLAPFKLLLKECKVPQAVLDSIPDDLLIEALAKEGGDLMPQLRRLLGKRLTGDLAKAFNALAKIIEAAMARMPARFFEYLGAAVPNRFQFEIGVLPSGGLRAAFRCGRPGEEKPVPLAFMLPMMMPLPELVGFTLRGFSVGLAGGGSLALLEVDGHVDRFPLPDLLAAAGLPDTVLSKKSARALTHRVVLKDVLAVAPTAAPFPIPLFYKELGLDLKHISGLELQAHWKFPKPELGLFAIVTFIEQYVRFFTEEAYLLHQQPEPEDFRLALTIGENYLKLPDYLGGVALGLQRELPEVNIYATFARLLDAAKTGNAGYLIQAIPLHYKGHWIRIGRQELRFGPLFLEAAWCITTEKEFSDEILGNAEAMKLLEHAGGEEILTSLPEETHGPSLNQGFIVLLMAGAGIDAVLSGRTQFGIALTRDGGFETGFQWIVSAAELLDLVIGGRLKADEHGVEVEGVCQLLFDQRNLIRTNGKIHVKDTYFLVGIGIELSEQLKLAGDLQIDAEGITLEGKIDWGYAKGQALRGVTATARIDKEGLAVAFKTEIFNSPCEVGARLGGQAKTPRGHLDFAVSPELQKGLVDSFAGLGQEIGQAIDRLTGEITAQVAEIDQIAFNLEGLKNAIASQLEKTASGMTGAAQRAAGRSIDTWINRKVTNKLGIRGKVKKWANKNIKPEVNRTIARDLSGHVGAMKRQAAALRAATPKEGKQLILNSLNYLLKNYRSFDYRYKKTFRKKVVKTISVPVNYTYRFRMPEKTLVIPIGNAIKAVGKLSEGQTVVLQKQDLQKIEAERKKAIDRIAENAEEQVKDAIPQVKHISVETGLGLISPQQATIAVVLFHKGKTQEYKIAAELTDLVGCAKEAMKLLISELAGA